MVVNVIVLAVVLALATLYLIDRRANRGHSGSQPAHSSSHRSAAAVAAIAAPPAPTLAEDRQSTAQREQTAAESKTIIESAQREAAALRRAAQAEAEALRRSTQLDVEAALAGAQRTRDDAERAAATLARTAERDSQRAAQQEVERLTAQLRAEQADLASQQRALDDAEATLGARSAQVEHEENEVAAAAAQLDQRESELSQTRDELAARRAELDQRDRDLAAALADVAAARQLELERVAELSADDARAEVLRVAESAARRDAALLARDIEATARVEADSRARHIVAESVQRVASEQTAETVVSVMHLASDELKGRIIGREGRNIRAFEAVTGVNVIIDDTPEAVLLSCFDPVRREIGRVTLEALLADGRIHPHRIEEVYERSRDDVEQLCLRAAQEALLELRIDNVDPQLLPIIGRLKYRTSYGQNVLGHSLESGHIAGVMAAELGLAPADFQRAAFLHDIGKALTHEVEGSHAIVGAALLRQHGEREIIAHAVEAHHNEVPATTIEDVLTQASDACSAARPGARRESIEAYVQRLVRIEEIASARDGVEKVFAMQAGREVRVMVRPDDVDDLEAGIIAREIAKEIEDELTYPGQIRVTVVRESRSTEIAH